MKQNLFLSSAIIIACSFMAKPFAYTLSSLDPAKGAVKSKLEQSQAIL